MLQFGQTQTLRSTGVWRKNFYSNFLDKINKHYLTISIYITSQFPVIITKFLIPPTYHLLHQFLQERKTKALKKNYLISFNLLIFSDLSPNSSHYILLPFLCFFHTSPLLPSLLLQLMPSHPKTNPIPSKSNRKNHTPYKHNIVSATRYHYCEIIFLLPASTFPGI